MGGQSSGSQTRLWYQKGRVYARLAVCMWASVSVRRAALCAASVSSWGGTVRKARVLHVGCRLANTFSVARVRVWCRLRSLPINLHYCNYLGFRYGAGADSRAP